MLGKKKIIAMKEGLCTTLVATQLMGVWLAVAQTNNDCASKQHPSAIQANTRPVAAGNTLSAKPLIAVSPSRLDFGPVAVGTTNYLTFTVQNVGAGTLSGFALASPPFSTSNAFYSLGSFQRQSVAVRYVPKVKGTNLQSLVLKSGGGTTVTVSGCGGTALPSSTGLRVVATGP